jgi:hypothetical protein
MLLSAFAPSAAGAGFLSNLTHNVTIASSVPGNGDVNPYGVALVPTSLGKLVAGNFLVSNFNDSANLQGTGTTIIEIGLNGHKSLFAQITPANAPGCTGGIGLTTALVALSSGWVIVGSLPAPTGASASMQAGCLVVLNANGQVAETFSSADIDGPWDMTALDLGNTAVLFVSTVLNGTVAQDNAIHHDGNVVRLTVSMGPGTSSNPIDFPAVTSNVIIAHGFPERSDPAALVIGPTGLGLAADGTLYVADTLNSRIAAIPNALTTLVNNGTGTTVSSGGGLNGPLGIAIAPNGDILTVNSGDGNIVEITPGGSQVVVMNIDTTHTGAGTLFGLTLTHEKNAVVYVNDGNNTLNVIY